MLAGNYKSFPHRGQRLQKIFGLVPGWSVSRAPQEGPYLTSDLRQAHVRDEVGLHYRRISRSALLLLPCLDRRSIICLSSS